MSQCCVHNCSESDAVKTYCWSCLCFETIDLTHLFIQHDHPFEVMTEGVPLSFSQAKALVSKQKLTEDEVQTLKRAPPTIFAECDKAVGAANL